MKKDFITLADFTGGQLQALIDQTISEKPAYLKKQGPAPHARKTLAMIFEKPSLRTRVSFETAMTQLGGTATYLDQIAIGLGTREPAKDVARVLGRMCDAIMARTFRHDIVEELAQYSDVPVVNGLTDYSHPCQAMADLVTIREHHGELKGKTIVFVGDGNNVARSLSVGCAKLDMKFILSCPPGYELDETFFDALLDEHPQSDCSVIHEPGRAVASADVVYTDTWISMGQEDQRQDRIRTFQAYQVNEALMALAPKHAIVLHCLPAYRGCEISEGVFEKNADAIFDQAENRLHFQRTLLNVLLTRGGIA
ncbi:MAG: ornithine carbamoyltransferase [Phycisphaerae bacterium]|nr:ornithine carbamoyltransferase [Phycisphaerae bacterium]